WESTLAAALLHSMRQRRFTCKQISHLQVHLRRAGNGCTDFCMSQPSGTPTLPFGKNMSHLLQKNKRKTMSKEIQPPNRPEEQEASQAHYPESERGRQAPSQGGLLKKMTFWEGLIHYVFFGWLT